MFLVRMYVVSGGRQSLFLVQTYVGGPPYVRSANITRTYVEPHKHTLLFEIPFG
jgi:hypothetical protein